jgi:L-lactate dehydrogenase complex protein LldE
VRGRITYHDSCHLLRGLHEARAPRAILGHLEGVEVVDLPGSDECCGFGGSFSVRYPHVSGAMVSDKANCILASGADAVVSTDAGCLMNIGGRLRRLGRQVEVLHLAELLDRR